MSAVESLTVYGLQEGFASNNTGAISLKSILKEMQGLRIGVMTGANATRAEVADILTGDAPLAVLVLNTGGVGKVRRIIGPASLAIPVDGFLTVASGNISDSTIGLVFWWKKAGYTSWAAG